ncbi:NAD(P)H-hydrate dehydratase [soil metagenome]
MKRRAVKYVTRALLRRWPLPLLDEDRGKVSRGSLLIVGGSDRTPGAVVLAGLGGLRVGAGTLQIATSRGAAAIVATAAIEASVLALPSSPRGEISARAIPTIVRSAQTSDAIVLGPGASEPRLCAAIRSDAIWIVDASVLAGYAQRAPGKHVILTPHAGEMATLCGTKLEDVIAHPLELAVSTARELDVVVALKGRITYVATHDGRVFANTAGNHGLGTSGSGDVLAGVIGGLAARGADAVQAAVWGVHLHALAGDALRRRIGPLGYLARELLEELPRVLSRV